MVFYKCTERVTAYLVIYGTYGAVENRDWRRQGLLLSTTTDLIRISILIYLNSKQLLPIFLKSQTRLSGRWMKKPTGIDKK